MLDPHSVRGVTLPLFLADSFTPREEVAGGCILHGVTADRDFLLPTSPDLLLMSVS